MKFHDVIRSLIDRTVDPETAAGMHKAIDEHEKAAGPTQAAGPQKEAKAK